MGRVIVLMLLSAAAGPASAQRASAGLDRRPAGKDSVDHCTILL